MEKKRVIKTSYWNLTRILVLAGALLAVSGCFLPCFYYHFFFNMAVIFWEGDGKYLVACVVIAVTMSMLPVRMSNFLSIIPTVIGALILFLDLRNAGKEFGVLVSIGIGFFVMFLGIAIMVAAEGLLFVKESKRKGKV